MPEIGPRVHELRIPDGALKTTWRVIYRIDSDAIIIVESFAKKTGATPEPVKALCRKRLSGYDKNS
jgi:phage-related protein